MAGTAKAFHLPFDYVLYGMSYANTLLYGASLPVYIPKERRKNTGDPRFNGTAYGAERIKADDPRNTERMRKILSSMRD